MPTLSPNPIGARIGIGARIRGPWGTRSKCLSNKKDNEEGINEKDSSKDDSGSNEAVI